MKKIFLLLLAHAFITSSYAQPTVQNLLCENRPDPIGLDTRQPRFSWQLVSPKRGVLQTAYEIKLGRTASLKGNELEWTTGKKDSDSSVLVAYQGMPLQAEQRYYWQVRVWDESGKASAWSTPAFFQMAFLDSMAWKASWIEPGYQEDSVLRPSPLMRKQFTAAKKIRSATAYITAHGLYEAQLNGKRIGDAYITPGWTSYNKRLQYQVYDVTDMVKQGANAIGVALSSGWYRGNLAWSSHKDIYGKDIALLFQLQLVYTDGTRESIVSDGSWKSATGPIRFAEIYHGETIDNNLEQRGWATAGYNDQNWSGVKVAAHPKSTLVATYNEPVKKQEVFKPVRVFTTPAGEQVLDFGQNLVGWVTTKARGKQGDKIILSHAEVLDKKGNFYIENLRAAKAQDTYILSGQGEETFEPHFTWHGFRFVKVEGYPGKLDPNNFTAVALYSDMKQTGSFTSSNPAINQLQHNIEWGLRGNFLDVPTDCPQRDERLGWTGDAQVFSRTATYLRDAHNFFAKWMKDVSADQHPDGSVPHVIPNVLGDGGGSAGWSDVACVIPWNIYLAYGDKRVLDDQYPGMKAWVHFMQQQSTANLWNKGFHFGDWLFYSVNDDRDGSSAITNKYLIAQCFYAHSTQLLINAAGVLHKKADVLSYTKLLEDIKTAFVHEYMTLNGASMSNTQTSYVLALNFDMLPENMRAQAAARLVANIGQYGNHLTTGFLGTPYLCHVLSRFGYTDIAYRLLLQDTYPSWLYPVKMGATTIWERWDGIRPDSSFETPTMNSYNHYAYGAIGDWMYRVAAGIDTDPDGPGYKKIWIKPHPGQGFTHMDASYLTPYGKAGSSWKLENGKLLMEVEIPANTTATVWIPAAGADSVLEGGRKPDASPDIKVVSSEDGYVVVKIGSGKYQFVANTKEGKQAQATAGKE